VLGVCPCLGQSLARATAGLKTGQVRDVQEVCHGNRAQCRQETVGTYRAGAPPSQSPRRRQEDRLISSHHRPTGVNTSPNFYAALFCPFIPSIPIPPAGSTSPSRLQGHTANNLLPSPGRRKTNTHNTSRSTQQTSIRPCRVCVRTDKRRDLTSPPSTHPWQRPTLTASPAQPSQSPSLALAKSRPSPYPPLAPARDRARVSMQAPPRRMK
jgi:hypothetical protein